MSIFAPAMGVIWKQLDEYGIDPDPVFRAEGIDPETLTDETFTPRVPERLPSGLAPFGRRASQQPGVITAASTHPKQRS